MTIPATTTRKDLRSAHAAESRPPRRIDAVRNAVVTVFGVLGFAVIGWLLLAWMFNLSVIVFVTGSMSPTMPAGSAAVVQSVAAADLEPGDVVTVTQPKSGLPITHRITEIDRTPGDGAERSLTLKGDANNIEDAEPYVVDTAQRVLVAAPMTGWLVIWSKSPIVMVVGSLVVAGAMTWGLWPSPSDDKETP